MRREQGRKSERLFPALWTLDIYICSGNLRQLIKMKQAGEKWRGLSMNWKIKETDTDDFKKGRILIQNKKRKKNIEKRMKYV